MTILPPTMRDAKVNELINRNDMMQTAYITDTAERARALEVLARMKEMEAKRKKKMKTVRLDSRTIVCSTKGMLQERLEKHKVDNAVVKKKRAPIYNEESRWERREMFESVFGSRESLTRNVISKRLRERYGFTPNKVSRLIKASVLDGDLSQLTHDTKDMKFMLNKKK